MVVEAVRIAILVVNVQVAIVLPPTVKLTLSLPATPRALTAIEAAQAGEAAERNRNVNRMMFVFFIFSPLKKVIIGFFDCYFVKNT